MEYGFIEYLTNGVIVENIDTFEITYINNSAKELLNLSADKNITSLKDILHNEDEVFLLRDRINVDLKNENVFSGNMYFMSKNDVVLEASFNCTWFNKEKGLISYILQNPVEVTEKQHLKFQEVAEFLPSGVVVMDIEADMSVTYANAEHYKIMGIDESKQAINTLLRDTIYEEDKDWVMEEVYHNLNNNKEVDIEFRMKVEEDKLKWVRLYGRARKSSTGSNLFYSSLKDLSNRREINDKLHLERILFHKMTEMTDEILFRIDLKSNIIYFLGSKFNKVFDYENSVWENFPQCIIDQKIIFEDDIPVFNNMIKSFQSGESKIVELRLHTHDSKVKWYQLPFDFVKTGDGEPILVIGKLINIQKQKILEAQAKTDLLTDCYNKINTGVEINNVLLNSESSSEHALLIIDIDNFKEINDNLGHHFGDIVLHDIANDIRSCFRKNDIIGRIGGDEFIVFLRDCDDVSMVEEKATTLCDRLEKTFHGQNGNYSISASVGVALSPTHGVSYETLYQMADIALYQTKENGKNGFTIYNTESVTEKRQNASKIHSARRNTVSFIDVEVIATVFNLLYETNDIKLSLNTILEYIGKTYNVERCYIYQTLDCGRVYKNDYQWDENEGFISEERVQYVSENVLMSILENANEDGVLVTDDIYTIKNKKAISILEKDNVKSLYIVESLKSHDRKAFFGVDDCKENRVWTEKEQKTLFHVGRIIFGSLTAYNIMDRMRNQIHLLEDQVKSEK